MNNNKIALITGGSRGLGKNMAQHLAQKGINVVLTYNNKKDEAEAMVAELEQAGVKAAALQLNAGDVKSFDGFVAELKESLSVKFGTEKIDFLVNNAGFGLHKSFAETTEEEFDNIINIHFKGVFFLTQKLLNVISDGGRIINISSGLARFSMVGTSAYGAAKGAIETLSRYMAKELGPRGIAVNVVAPGAIATDFSGGRVRDNAEVNKMVSSVTALGRAGVPDDIGGIVAFLCTEDARWINAQRLEASGGMNI
ncbi:NAD(P)-dependent dehydrogenase (short-subunit alcohol dehydrogenase family) [Mucilaginibacter yixingensis]|uniref:NAD(P)-dependent dehydrogenase (Short-subunit alcohol dehydrogenase family) n=1 Tax=Mucilaginibacter yixingensis TaxID=1295612 RepID=A0A2T5J6L4_9SPHI|nr:SDR family oxidoreductase [Mucilaginibacter yixingensis]PTQ94096.1 NAD(P)-dependent dehydrogenase (short-subunit alcohol dehydrogenase family) [Mucilaginibacter yixingensis]